MTEKIGETSIAFTRIFLVQNKMKVTQLHEIGSKPQHYFAAKSNFISVYPSIRLLKNVIFEKKY